MASAELFRRILSLEVHDERRFTLHLDRVTYDYNDIGGLVLPAHIDRANFDAEPAEYRNRTAYDADSANPGLWFGPYRAVRVEPGATIEFKRNPTWWGEPAAFETVIIRIVENTAALEVNLRSGAIDYIAGELGLSLDQAAAMEQREGDAWDFAYKAGLIYEHIDLNLDNPVLGDARVRRALLHAIDRETLSQKLFFGRQPVAHGPRESAPTGSMTRTCTGHRSIPTPPGSCSTKRAGPMTRREPRAATPPASRSGSSSAPRRATARANWCSRCYRRLGRMSALTCASATGPRGCSSAKRSRSGSSRAWRCMPGCPRRRACRARHSTPP